MSRMLREVIEEAGLGRIATHGDDSVEITSIEFDSATSA